MQRWPQLRFQEPVRTGNEKCRREISTSRSRRQDINVRCASKAVSLTDSATRGCAPFMDSYAVRGWGGQAIAGRKSRFSDDPRRPELHERSCSHGFLTR
jgi:hypothetical protein